MNSGTPMRRRTFLVGACAAGLAALDGLRVSYSSAAPIQPQRSQGIGYIPAHALTQTEANMLQIRRANERGAANHGWLDSRHTFSFGEYHDPKHMGFGPLRVINEDRVQPGRGFATHAHRDMEIISYVLDGELAHADSLGNGSVIRPGDVQRMSAGTGVSHSEFNSSETNPVHFLQIWILPERAGAEPGYEQIRFSEEDKRGRLRLVGSPNGADGSVTIHRDVYLYASLLKPGESVTHEFGERRKGWIQVARGTVAIGDQELAAGDGVALEGKQAITIQAVANSEFLLFDMG